mgnify:CR=1 FL=1
MSNGKREIGSALPATAARQTLRFGWSTATTAETLREALAQLFDEQAAAPMQTVTVDDGGSALRAGDLAWARAMARDCREAGVALRAQFVLHDRGLRTLAVDDLL